MLLLDGNRVILLSLPELVPSHHDSTNEARYRVILILTNKRDSVVDRLEGVLHACGQDYFRFNTEEFPSAIGGTLRFDPVNGTKGWLVSGDRKVDLDDITMVWNRRPRQSNPHSELDPIDQEFVLRETNHVLESLYHLLQDRAWINPFHANRAAERKLLQLKTAQQVGLTIPKTIVANDPKHLQDFLIECDGRIVYKTLSSLARMVNGRGHTTYTTRVSQSQLTKLSDAITLAPCLIQQEVPKAIEYRVTVMGNTFFNAAIDSQSKGYTKIDWRKSAMVEPLATAAPEVPEDLKDQILNLMSRMRLVFGCLDFIKTPLGDWVFLEINPNGEWLWVADATGLPMIDAFVCFLKSKSPRNFKWSGVRLAEMQVTTVPK